MNRIINALWWTFQILIFTGIIIGGAEMVSWPGEAYSTIHAATLRDVWSEKEAPLTTVWEYDHFRAESARIEEQNRLADEFARTNSTHTGTNVWSELTFTNSLIIHTFNPYEIQFSKGQRELGYRSDGVVVWRIAPEAPK